MFKGNPDNNLFSLRMFMSSMFVHLKTYLDQRAINLELKAIYRETRSGSILLHMLQLLVCILIQRKGNPDNNLFSLRMFMPSMFVHQKTYLGQRAIDLELKAFYRETGNGSILLHMLQLLVYILIQRSHFGSVQ